jgi:hypothetical protein
VQEKALPAKKQRGSFKVQVKQKLKAITDK